MTHTFDWSKDWQRTMLAKISLATKLVATQRCYQVRAVGKTVPVGTAYLLVAKTGVNCIIL